MPQPLKDILSAPLPLSVVVFLVIQTMGSVWWASAQVNDVHLQISSIRALLDRIVDESRASASQEGRIIVLEQVIERTVDDVKDIKDTLKTKGLEHAK
jgi:hypothetical protein